MGRDPGAMDFIVFASGAAGLTNLLAQAQMAGSRANVSEGVGVGGSMSSSVFNN